MTGNNMNVRAAIFWLRGLSLLIISMVDMRGKFSITINTQFDFTKYAEALQTQFEKHGIPVISKENIGKACCKKTEFNLDLFLKK